MTELKKLLIEFDTLTQKNRGLSLSKQIDLLEQSLQSKYSVNLRNTGSSVDNTSDEQLHSDEELVSKIEDIVCNLISTINLNDVIERIKSLKEFQQELKSLFQNHRNNVSKPIIQQVDKRSTELEITSQIEDMIDNLVYYLSCSEKDFEENKLNSQIDVCKKKLKSLFQTHRNAISKPVKQKDDNLINELELASKIEAIALNHCTGTFKWCSEISMSENEFSDFTSEVIALFRNSIEPVFRALNNSDEQSIIK